ncbi:uncharacterized protein LOC126906975 isoform X2 [Daktulosphaira vitifoliae]|uniref:uncharacterized protein LOC126906975 isoform X2 n=1 Tax=Daktulosphaira vitifoliae TaxID=58002 RepID=UPI0021AA6DF7|nr:uncharacterized protein LOC126906975 isoform X2 [Daktulosphaira vitifoliae]
MLYKIINLILIFVYTFLLENVFAAILLISPKKITIDNDCSTKSGQLYRTDAKLIKVSNCFKGTKVYVECGILKVTFEHMETNIEIFAEIFVNYNHTSIKSSIELKIIFKEKGIVMINKKDENQPKQFSYDVKCIKALESYIKDLDEKIKFKVVKIYNSNHESYRPLDNETIYRSRVKRQLQQLTNMSLWKYVKKELITFKNKSFSTTLEGYINNSTTYNKTIKETLEEINPLINDRVYSYWDKFVNIFEKLKDTQKTFTNQNYLTVGHNEFCSEKYTSKKINKICKLEKHLIEYFLNSKKLLNCDLTTEKCSMSYKTKILDEIFKDFPEPPNKNKPYNFHKLPTTFEEILYNLDTIVKIVEVEFDEVYKIEL